MFITADNFQDLGGSGENMVYVEIMRMVRDMQELDSHIEKMRQRLAVEENIVTDNTLIPMPVNVEDISRIVKDKEFWSDIESTMTKINDYSKYQQDMLSAYQTALAKK